MISLGEAYVNGLNEVLNNGLSVSSVKNPNSIASNFGKSDRPYLEIIGYRTEIDSSKGSLVYSKSRLLNLSYCVGLFLWTIKGSEFVEELEYYHPFARNMSDDGNILYGSFGKRLFNYNNLTNQVDTLVNYLKKDKYGRRGFLVISRPEDNTIETKDYPCCIGLQFFIRNHKLICVNHMRAQSAFNIFPYDSWLFITLHHYISSKLGLSIGKYVYVCGTYHIYEAEREIIKKQINDKIYTINVGHFQNESKFMPKLLTYEKKLQQYVKNKDREKIKLMHNPAFPENTFYRFASLVLKITAFEKCGISVSNILQSELSCIGDIYLRSLITENYKDVINKKTDIKAIRRW